MKHQQNETPGVNDETTPRRRRHRIATALATVVCSGAMLAGGLAVPSVANAKPVTNESKSTQSNSTQSNSTPSNSTLSAAQRATLLGVAKDTWQFFEKDVDPVTHLPLDNLGPGTVRGAYTSAANIGVYLESVVAANDLGIISRPKAVSLISATLKTVGTLQSDHGFLYQWYATDSGHTILNPGAGDCPTQTALAQDNCSFLSAVDNGWYASGLLVVRSALPELKTKVNALIAPMDFSIFYDNRAQTTCNTNPAIPGNQPTGQMYGGYYTGQGPAGYHNGALYSDPRIAMYVGMGLHQMPGDVWWRTWRTLPPKQCDTDPDFTWQGQAPAGYWTTINDPQTGKPFRV